MLIMKRAPVKYIRDRAKGAYVKAGSCYICGDSGRLDLHHYSSITQLFEKWSKGRDVSDILACRDEFIAEHRVELYDEVVTLCHKHHLELHGVYGVKPLLSSASAQRAWVERKRAKLDQK